MSDLLNLNVDQLFEQHSVASIEKDVGRKLKQEISRKEEELRTMVGERYRDLLKAADTINEMKKTSFGVIQRIEDVSSKCKLINEKQLIGFKAETPTRGVKSSPKLAFFSLVTQVKILTVLPEMILTQLDKEEYFLAAQLFIFARHINTGLKFEVNQELLKRFPVAKQQWEVLSQFFFIIKNRCNERLELDDLSSEVAAKCLASLILLESCDLETVLRMLLKQQTNAFKTILMDKNEKHKKVKDKLLASLNVLNRSLALVYECFISYDNEKGILSKELSYLSSNKAPFTISYISFDQPESLKFLPDIIAKYRPNLSFTDLSLDKIQLIIKDWFDNLKNIAKTDIRSLVNLISTVKVIHDIKQKSLEQEKHKEWDEICNTFGLPDKIDFYKEFYLNLINERVKDIIQSNWNETLKEVQKEVEKYLNSKQEKTMNKFVWTEDSSDIPKSLAQALNSDTKSHKLLMKSLGFVPETVEICVKFDKNMEILYKDVDTYLNKDSGRSNKESSIDKRDLVDFLITTSKEGLENLVLRIKEIKSNSMENTIKIARLLQAIGELCPNLKLCLSNRTDFGSGADFIALKSPKDTWEKSQKFLEEESLNCWQLWSEDYFKDWVKLNRPLLLQNTSLSMFLQEFANWETILIEEKDEEEKSVQSTIKIPSQPSFPLQKALFCLASDLNNLAPQTVPSVIVANLADSIVQEILSIYEEFNKSDLIKSNQNISLQYFFDIKFLALMFISRDSHRSSSMDKSHSLANEFKSQIDPFDFELFYRYLNENVKRSVSRMQNMLGNLIPNMEHLTTILGNQNLNKVQDKEPNILLLAGTEGQPTAWFPLLPIASSGQIHDDKVIVTSSQQMSLKSNERRQESGPSAGVVSATQNYASNVKSGAAAFFGAMSQDWFK